MGDTDISSNSTLNVSELFYSLQGEGTRTGEASLFVRLQGCSAKHACYQSKVYCDTEFESGGIMNLSDIGKFASLHKALWIVWTGGEPTDQLTSEIIDKTKRMGYKQSIECSGIKQPPSGLDWVVLSPKIAEHIILKKWELRNEFHCDELRWVRHSGQSIPNTKIKAKEYFISPHFDNLNPNDKNVKHCIKLCMENPTWKLSVQQHKLWQIL